MEQNNNINTVICPHCKTENPDISICVTCGKKIKGEQVESKNFFMLVSEKIFEALDFNRLISVIIAICYLAIATYFLGGEGLFRMLGFLILPMGCIWYGDDVGGYTEAC